MLNSTNFKQFFRSWDQILLTSEQLMMFLISDSIYNVFHLVFAYEGIFVFFPEKGMCGYICDLFGSLYTKKLSFRFLKIWRIRRTGGWFILRMFWSWRASFCEVFWFPFMEAIALSCILIKILIRFIFFFIQANKFQSDSLILDLNDT